MGILRNVHFARESKILMIPDETWGARLTICDQEYWGDDKNAEKVVRRCDSSTAAVHRSLF
jgi:hypothetical protein